MAAPGGGTRGTHRPGVHGGPRAGASWLAPAPPGSYSPYSPCASSYGCRRAGAGFGDARGAPPPQRPRWAPRQRWCVSVVRICRSRRRRPRWPGRLRRRPRWHPRRLLVACFGVTGVVLVVVRIVKLSVCVHGFVTTHVYVTGLIQQGISSCPRLCSHGWGPRLCSHGWGLLCLCLCICLSL
jgi:hypothetical protein